MNKTKQIFLTIIFILFFFSMSGIKVFAHDSYFLAVTIDDGSDMYRGEIVSESGKKTHREVELGDFIQWINKKDHKMKGTKLPAKNADKEPNDVYHISPNSSGTMLFYTFPGIHKTGMWVDTVNASDKDLALAQRVVDYPLTGLNDAISFIISETGWTRSSSTDSIRDIGMHLGNYDESFKVNGKTVHATRSNVSGKVIKDMGIKANDYVKITIDGTSKTFVYRCYKGYIYPKNEEKNDPLYYMGSDRYEKYRNNLEKNGEIYHMTWRMLVLQGNYNYDGGNTYSNISNITAPSEFENTFVNFADGALNSIRNMLGLYSMEELMSNSGTRDANYNLGMFPSTWTNSAVLLHIICQMIAWAMIGFSIIKMLWKKQMATMNVTEKISLQEGIKNLILCGVLLGSFTLLFNFIARLNYRLVDLFSSSTTNLHFVKAAGASSTMGGFVVAFAVFVITVYFNFYYIVRAATLAILYGIAPLCIYTLSLGGKIAGTFTTFLKELLGNLFMQTIHAICLAFFSNVFISGNTRTLEQIVIMYSFIPIGNFVRKKVFGLEDGIASSTAQHMQTQLGDGINAARENLGRSKNHGSSRGGNSMTDGSLNQVIDAKVSKSTGNSDITMKDSSKGGYEETARGKTTVGYDKNTTGLKGISGASNQPVFSSLKQGLKAGGNVAMAAGKVGLGLGVGVVDPNTGASLIGSAGSNLGRARQNMINAKDTFSTNSALLNAKDKNGVSQVRYGKDLTSFKLDGGFDNNGTFVSNEGVDNNQNLNQHNIKEYGAMYRAQKHLANYTGNFNKISTSDIENAYAKTDNQGNRMINSNEKEILTNMVKNQVRLNKNEDGSYSVLRRSEDLQQMRNPYDRVDPMANLETLRGKKDNADKFSHRENVSRHPTSRK